MLRPALLDRRPIAPARTSRAGAVGAPPVQPSFADLDPPLRETTFVVVDLETTGGSAETDAITEIGAVKVRGGAVLGEFATLVDPGRSVPPQITMLTGISDAMLLDAPRIEQVLPAFLEFARGAVLVAHNARFDVGFLKAACRRMQVPWPAAPVVDTVRVARAALSKAEAPSVKLSALARIFASTVQPDHRALTDARATVQVLHGLLERLGSLGVHTLPELQDASRDVDPARRRKHTLADHLPAAPGVYLFRGPGDQVLYVGTSGNLRHRVRSYFSAAEQRDRIKRMVLLAERVDHVQCAHALEAEVREQRLIAAHQPPYNRRSRAPDKASWIVLTDEAFPRLSIVSRPGRHPPEHCLGPFSSRVRAQAAVEALQDAVPVRRCTIRIRRVAPQGTACALAELGRCGAPCSGREPVDDYAAHVARIRALIRGESDEVLQTLLDRLTVLAASGRFDRAAALRDRLSALVEAVDRGQRLRDLAGIAELVVAQADGSGGWHLAVVRHGRFVAGGSAPRGIDPMPVVDLLVASAETVLPGTGPLPAASAEETGTVLRWMARPGTRLVRTSAPWSTPRFAAARWRSYVEAAGLARRQLLDHW
nr:DEDD exonuclease domain-containing protein [Nakamurella leprariae]